MIHTLGRRGCVYCGWPRARVKHGRAVLMLPACRAHLDLLALDPDYGLADSLSSESADRTGAKRFASDERLEGAP